MDAEIMPETPLWGAPDQAARLAELTAGTDDRAKELPLRRDVRSLGTLLGRVLVAQAGEPLFKAVEQLRRLLIQSRARSGGSQSDTAEMQEARGIVQKLGIQEAYWVTKAFAIYFELANLAEANHRKRRRRAAKLNPDQPPLAGSFRGTLLRLRDSGMSADEALAHLRKIKVTPVFTAHPTEAARRTVLLKRRRIAKQLHRLDRLPLPASEARLLEDEIAAEIMALWQTDEVRVQRPQVTDEIRMGLDHYSMSIFESLPRVYSEIREAFREVYAFELAADQIPEVLSFGSWIGGDRDGNPFVTVESTAEALERARNAILGHYISEIQRAIEQLSSSCRQAPVSSELEERLNQYANRMGDEPARLGRVSGTERYRQLLSYILARLRKTQTESISSDSYRSAQEFEADIELLYASLEQNRGENLAALALDPLLRKVRTFSFHLAALDIRQHASAHTQALAEVSSSSHANGAEGPAVGLAPAASSMSENVLQTFRSVAKWKKAFPALAIRNYVISGTESEDDIYTVLKLAETCAVELRASAGDPGLMPVPLFESIHALRNSGGIMER